MNTLEPKEIQSLTKLSSSTICETTKMKLWLSNLIRVSYVICNVPLKASFRHDHPSMKYTFFLNVQGKRGGGGPPPSYLCPLLSSLSIDQVQHGIRAR